MDTGFTFYEPTHIVISWSSEDKCQIFLPCSFLLFFSSHFQPFLLLFGTQWLGFREQFIAFLALNWFDAYITTMYKTLAPITPAERKQKLTLGFICI